MYISFFFFFFLLSIIGKFIFCLICKKNNNYVLNYIIHNIHSNDYINNNNNALQKLNKICYKKKKTYEHVNIFQVTDPYDSKKKQVSRLNSTNPIHVGELRVGVITDVKDNNIYVQLKHNKEQVLIRRENNYLLENELLYEYLLNSRLISTKMYTNLTTIEKREDRKRNDDARQKIENKKEENINIKERENKKEQQEEQVNECIVLIKEVSKENGILGELYTDEIHKRKEKIYEKLNELKTLEKKIFIKILKNVKNKYYVVLINDCIKGYLLYDEIVEKEENVAGIDIKKRKRKRKYSTNDNTLEKLSAYIIDVNKKLEYVFLAVKKYEPHILLSRLAETQNEIVVENLFQNNYFKGEVLDFTNNGSNIIVKIFDNKTNSIKVKVKSYNIIHSKNILRNFDLIKNKVISHHFTKYMQGGENVLSDSIKRKEVEKRKRKHYDTYDMDSSSSKMVPTDETNSTLFLKKKDSERKKNSIKEKKELQEQLAQFKENYYGCLEPDAVKYINIDSYIYKEEKCIYVRIINKTVEKNVYEGSMIKTEETISKQTYDLWKQLASEENQISNYDKKLRYPSTVLGFFNNFVLLRTKVLNGNVSSLKEGQAKESEKKRNDSEDKEGKEEDGGKNENENVMKTGKEVNNENASGVLEERTNNVKASFIGKEENDLNQPKEVFTLIEKCFIDYENLKPGDIFFCRFEKTKNQNIRNLFNLSNEVLKDIYNTYYKEDMKRMKQVKQSKEANRTKQKHKGFTYHDTIPKTETESSNALTFENIFLKKKKIYIMRGELHKEIEYHLNKNNIDTTFKKLKNICDKYYSGFNKSYDHYSSIREEFISLYLGKEKYKLYRKIVGDYFSSNKHSYKEFLQSDCKILTSTVFDFVFDNPQKLTKEFIQNYNVDMWNKVNRLNVFELNCVLKDLEILKKEMYDFPLDMNYKTGRMNLLLNNQKPITKEVINNLKINADETKNNDIKKELLKVYKSKIIYPIRYVKELLVKKKNAKYGTYDELKTVYILAEETINLYENSAKDVKPFNEKDIELLKKRVLSKSKGSYMGMRSPEFSEETKEAAEEEKGGQKKKGNIINGEEETEGEIKNIHFVLFDPSNSQLRKTLYMIKDDLEMQKKKNKLDEVDKLYEEEQKQYTDITEVHKNLHELEEMNKLSKDMYYMKIPFIE